MWRNAHLTSEIDFYASHADFCLLQKRRGCIATSKNMESRQSSRFLISQIITNCIDVNVFKIISGSKCHPYIGSRESLKQTIQLSN